MIKSIDDVQKLGQTSVDNSMKLYGEWTKGWQVIATAMTDYTKRSYEDGTQTMEKLVGAKSLEQAMQIQTTWAQRAYDEYMSEMTKLGGLYANFARESFKPLEQMMNKAR